ncbi:hypothetical protein N7476_004849 [Penicillium atrosanguineum]|uniref:Uncharacterized protein n=1 Tax=Penicillium atrosanguineum TaxID=1132637 RepID=A0A9W9U4X6_9EURO|nr:hypothetical protein N7476_004849 [Penicillium atrosanguineum]
MYRGSVPEAVIDLPLRKTEEPANNYAKDNTKDTAEDNTKDTAEENTKDTAEENTKDTAEDNALSILQKPMNVEYA